MLIFLGIIISVIVLFLYSCLVISSRCSREEEKETLDKWFMTKNL